MANNLIKIVRLAKGNINYTKDAEYERYGLFVNDIILSDCSGFDDLDFNNYHYYMMYGSITNANLTSGLCGSIYMKYWEEVAPSTILVSSAPYEGEYHANILMIGIHK